MPFMHSKLHKDISGHIEGKPYRVLFDAEGYSTEPVSDDIANQLTSIKAAKIVQDAPPDDAAEQLDSLNVPQLKSYCKKNNIDYGDATKKVQLLEIISKHEKPKTEGSTTTDSNSPGTGGNGA